MGNLKIDWLVIGALAIDTGCGPIEYAAFGAGYPLLVAHGIFGGFDQGLWHPKSQ